MSTFFDLFLLSFLFWLAAWRLLGDRNGWLALANAWAWWLLTGAIPAGIVSLWRRSRLAALAWAIGGAALWLGKYGWMRPTPLKPRSPLPDRPRATSGASGELSLLTFNLLNDERDLRPVLDLVARERPDILLFQECIPSHAAQLDTGLAHAYPHRLWLPAPDYGMGFGIAARRPFVLSGFWAYPGFEPFAARVTLAFGDPVAPVSLVDIYCVQFISPTNEVRRVGPTVLLRLREQQLGWVLAEIERRKRAALVAGDWNMTEGSDAYGWAVDKLVDGWCEAGQGPGWSWPRKLNSCVDRAVQPLLRLDHTMHTGHRFAPDLTVTDIHVLQDRLGSDHCPLLATVKISAKPLAG